MSKGSMKIYSDKELKDQGNKYFNANTFESAIGSFIDKLGLQKFTKVFALLCARCAFARPLHFFSHVAKLPNPKISMTTEQKVILNDY